MVTPTPFPTPAITALPVTLPDVTSHFAMDAVQTWNMIPAGIGPAIQLVVILVIVVMGAMLIMNALKDL